MDRASLAAVAALEDDVRRALYEHVRAAGAPVTREDAAAAVGISRNLAAFHLDKLVELGLLRSGFGTGPRRVGRAPRVYEPAGQDIAVRVPERAPEVLADILVTAVLDQQPGEPATAAAARVARERGTALGAAERARLRTGRLGCERALAAGAEVLARAGYEPYRGADAAVRLRNCPFHPLAERAPAFVCGLNREYLAGLVDGLGAGDRMAAVLAPAPGECCVELRGSRPS
jgi:predicted ArsR family transcriptional regulator